VSDLEARLRAAGSRRRARGHDAGRRAPADGGRAARPEGRRRWPGLLLAAGICVAPSSPCPPFWSVTAVDNLGKPVTFDFGNYEYYSGFGALHGFPGADGTPRAVGDLPRRPAELDLLLLIIHLSPRRAVYSIAFCSRCAPPCWPYVCGGASRQRPGGGWRRSRRPCRRGGAFLSPIFRVELGETSSDVLLRLLLFAAAALLYRIVSAPGRPAGVRLRRPRRWCSSASRASSSSPRRPSRWRSSSLRGGIAPRPFPGGLDIPPLCGPRGGRGRARCGRGGGPLPPDGAHVVAPLPTTRSSRSTTASSTRQTSGPGTSASATPPSPRLGSSSISGPPRRKETCRRLSTGPGEVPVLFFGLVIVAVMLVVDLVRRDKAPGHLPRDLLPRRLLSSGRSCSASTATSPPRDGAAAVVVMLVALNRVNPGGALCGIPVRSC